MSLLTTLAEVVIKYEGENLLITEEMAGFLAGLFAFLGFICFLLIILILVDAWMIFKKMGRKGWEGIIPIYNVYVACRETGLNPWWILTILFPPAFALFAIVLGVRICEGFGKTTLFSVLTTMFIPICATILAFDKSKWDAGRINFESAKFLNDEDGVKELKPKKAKK